MADTCDRCPNPAVWDLVVTDQDGVEHGRRLCGPCYDAATQMLRFLDLPFASRVS